MGELTHVDLVWLKKRIENWIRFGRTAEEHVVDRQRRIVSSRQAVSLRSSAAGPTTTAPSSHGSMFCAR
jgi:hypothetical protein